MKNASFFVLKQMIFQKNSKKTYIIFALQAKRNSAASSPAAEFICSYFYLIFQIRSLFRYARIL